ncbi:hypothetical protein, partial [Stieleria sp.]|uniref:hypothetical protein n=1 Tax=Stieleria sp. TaxID=2795976 RepID=UPI0035690FB1
CGEKCPNAGANRLMTNDDQPFGASLRALDPSTAIRTNRTGTARSAFSNIRSALRCVLSLELG